MTIASKLPAKTVLSTHRKLPVSKEKNASGTPTRLPTHLDLPCSDDKPVDNDYHPLQTMILRSSLAPHLERLHPDGNYYVGSDTGIYWKLTDPLENGIRAPDFFYVPNVPRLLDGKLRRSYVMWMEKKPPLLVVEYLSGKGREERDATPHKEKFWVYEKAIRAKYYALWDPDKEKLEVLELKRRKYQPMSANSHGRFAIAPMAIELGPWKTTFLDTPEVWLRAFDREGNLLLAAEEMVDREKQRAEQEKQRADKLAARLRELGIDPDSP
ncbi:MAG TPA: Uma2 family endonuclease [Urbifossiella sp.]|jgi:Uma2 family endonuclease